MPTRIGPSSDGDARDARRGSRITRPSASSAAARTQIALTTNSVEAISEKRGIWIAVTAIGVFRKPLTSCRFDANPPALLQIGDPPFRGIASTPQVGNNPQALRMPFLGSENRASAA